MDQVVRIDQGTLGRVRGHLLEFRVHLKCLLKTSVMLIPLNRHNNERAAALHKSKSSFLPNLEVKALKGAEAIRRQSFTKETSRYLMLSRPRLELEI